MNEASGRGGREWADGMVPEVRGGRISSVALGVFLMLGMMVTVPLAQMVKAPEAERPPAIEEGTEIKPPPMDFKVDEMQAVQSPHRLPEAPMMPPEKPVLEPIATDVPRVVLSGIPTTTGSLRGFIRGFDAREILDSMDLDGPPRLLHAPAPRAPYRLREGVELVVLLTVDAEGRVIAAEVERSTNEDFSRAVLEVVRRWVFEPGTVEGRAVSFRMRQLFRFD